MKATVVISSHFNFLQIFGDTPYSVTKTAEKIPVYRCKSKDINAQPVPLDSSKKTAIQEVVKEALKTENINIAPIWPEVDDTIVDELERELDQDKLSNYLRL